VSELWHYRDLLIQLVRREIVVRYRHSILGIGWALLQPLSLMLLFTFVFARHMLPADKLRELGAPYPLWVYMGLLPWTLFAMGLTNATQNLAAQRDLVTKVYFPQQILPLSGIASAFFDFCVASIVVVGLVFYYQTTSDWKPLISPTLLLLPVVIAVQLLLMIGLGLWLALGNLWFRDVKYLFSVSIQMWMFLSNVIYPLDNGSTAVRLIAMLNPMVPIISAYRRIMIEGRLPDAVPFMSATVIAIILAVSSWEAYRRLEGRFAERI